MNTDNTTYVLSTFEQIPAPVLGGYRVIAEVKRGDKTFVLGGTCYFGNDNLVVKYICPLGSSRNVAKNADDRQRVEQTVLRHMRSIGLDRGW